MYGRRLVLIIISLIAAFFLFLLISFWIYPLINPEAAESSQNIDMPPPPEEYYPYNFVEFGPARVRDLKSQISDLEQRLDQKDQREQQMLSTIDSLYRVTENQEQQLANGQAGTQQQGFQSSFAASREDPFASPFGGGPSADAPEDPVTELAKSLATLDEEELGPILNRLSDTQLVQLYQSTSSIRREKLLRSLDPGKAATLIRRVM